MGIGAGGAVSGGIIMKILAVALVALCVAGCARKADEAAANVNAVSGNAAAAAAPAPAASDAPQDAEATPALALATDGLKLDDVESGKSDTVGFGTGQDDTVSFISRALGAPTKSALDEACDGGALGTVDFQGGLRLFFKAGDFVGWQVDDESGYKGVNGIALGMRYADVNKLAREVEGEDSSLGHEFTADGYHGLLTEGGPNGVVTTLWAGTICANR